jgi:hypothetical protein
MKTKYQKLPWNRPVPVKRSNFKSLHKSGQQFNVETNLGEIRSFSFGEKRSPEDDLLYADQQFPSAYGLGQIWFLSG